MTGTDSITFSRPQKSSRRSAASLAIALAFAICAGCKKSGSESPARETKLVIFAASSLRDAFTVLATAFKAKHPDVSVEFNFAGSQELRTQVEQGADCQVIATADLKHMDALHAAKLVEAPTVFARNTPVMVVRSALSGELQTFADLPKAEKIVIGAETVPIGKYTHQILDRANGSLGSDFRSRVEAHVVSHELNVKQVLAKVKMGEADAALVYRTDVGLRDEDVSVIEIPAEINVVADYPIAKLASSKSVLAAEWIQFVLSDEGQKLLLEQRFSPIAVTGVANSLGP